MAVSELPVEDDVPGEMAPAPGRVGLYQRLAHHALIAPHPAARCTFLRKVNRSYEPRDMALHLRDRCPAKGWRRLAVKSCLTHILKM